MAVNDTAKESSSNHKLATNSPACKEAKTHAKVETSEMAKGYRRIDEILQAWAEALADK